MMGAPALRCDVQLFTENVTTANSTKQLKRWYNRKPVSGILYLMNCVHGVLPEENESVS